MALRCLLSFGGQTTAKARGLPPQLNSNALAVQVVQRIDRVWGRAYGRRLCLGSIRVHKCVLGSTQTLNPSHVVADKRQCIRFGDWKHASAFTSPFSAHKSLLLCMLQGCKGIPGKLNTILTLAQNLTANEHVCPVI